MIACGKCGKDNDPHYKFCLGCGSELPSSAVLPTPTTRGWLDSAPIAVAESTPVVIPDAVEKTASTRTCGTCGTIAPAGFTFCGQCGARVDAAPRVLRPTGASGITKGRLQLIRADGSEGGEHALTLGGNLIGRGLGPLFDADGYLSPKHAELVLDSEQATIRDTSSLNGIFLRMTEEEEIYDGDVFRVGQELLRFDLLPPAEPLADGTHIMGSPPGDAWARLVLVVAQDQDGTAYLLSGESMLIGRERGDILFPDDGYVSGTHARVSQRNGRHYLADLNSSNGTFMRLRGERVLQLGALLLMGQQLFRVSYS